MKHKMRQVRAYSNIEKKEIIGTGKFHIWGNEPIPSRVGFTTRTAAIVEFEDGSVKYINPECIEFINR